MTQVDIHSHKILILDFGSQFTQLIARRVREASVFCEIHPWDMPDPEIRNFAPRGVILSGGPESVIGGKPPSVSPEVFALEVPVLGICYGMQAMAAQLGGVVTPSKHREFGYARVRVLENTRLIGDLADHTDSDGNPMLDVWMSHGDRVDEVPPGFVVFASTDNAPLAAMADEGRSYYALQFHPEVTHTTQGTSILRQFLFDVCACNSQWRPGNIVDESIRTVRDRVGKERILLALSGGVDSSVVAALLHRAVGDQLTCVFVDHGLLREAEGDQVMDTFARHMGINVIRINAEDRFLESLRGVTDPEEKRRIIGNLFIKVFEEESLRLEGIKWLAQGTIYPDVIESAGAKTAKAHVIKTHHNVGGLPETMNLELIEPLRELFKDEVRKIGLELGLPYEMVHRHPFPGPGLGVRILGEVRREYADLLRCADAIFIEELLKNDLYHKTSQAFAVFMPVRSVAVMGDGRRYDYVIALRAVETSDFMTAHWARLPYEFLDHVSRRIINEIEGISRVTYDISGKPPATIEWE
ncbi:MAG: glutamine-hydrolyzing GMP synthase [Gammaproteobacteria bacterium]